MQIIHKVIAPVNEHEVLLTIQCWDGSLPQYLLACLDATVTLENNLRSGISVRKDYHYGNAVHMRKQ